MKVFITKYALTKGIVEAEAEGMSNEDLVWVNYLPGGKYIWKPHWHSDRASAVERAYAMKRAKLASLEKQIAKLRKLEFK